MGEQKIRLINNWASQNLKCRFCGSTKSVKYKAKIVTAKNPDGEEICCCNKCALVHNDKFIPLEG